MRKFFSVLPQYLVPQHLYTRFFGWLAGLHQPQLKNWMINTFIRRYKVNMQDAEREKPEEYATFNDFFTRRLKLGLRPIANQPGQIACPVDGTISQIGKIEHETLLQAKGFYYNLASLLGNDFQMTTLFENGNFATLYLSPKDYHRIHMPLAGSLRETLYIPGKLFSVNQKTAAAVPQLFSRNERLVCLFDTEIGPMAMILVGAMIVGGIHTIWNDNPKSKMITTQKFSGITFERGAEMGHFRLGSTVILLFGKDKIAWQQHMQANTTIQMGQLLGTIK
jgi:phosphatidylserine decarboxylase